MLGLIFVCMHISVRVCVLAHKLALFCVFRRQWPLLINHVSFISTSVNNLTTSSFFTAYRISLKFYSTVIALYCKSTILINAMLNGNN